MTSWVRSTSRRLLAVCALLLCAAPLAAQEVAGKIEGTVSDQAGVPLANAQVLIVGTSYGAVTNDRGYYFINNVPVGTYSVRAQFIGYQPTEVRGVRVQGGQTQTVDVRLQASAVEVTGVTVTAAANPIVPRDQVTSKGIVEGELINQLPVNDVRQILTLTPGVVESGSARGVSVRGGRPGEAAVYIDGAPVRSAMFGTQALDVGTNAVEEASVTTGALGVEFSDAQSGLISYTTRAGGQQLSGSLTYESDEAFSNTASVGYNRFEGSLGGPIPGVTNLTWFLSGVLQGQLSNFRGKGAEDNPVFTTGGLDQMVSTRGSDGSVTQVALPQYVQYGGSCDAADNYGYECQGWQRPMDWSNFNQLQGKLQFSYGSGSTVALTGLSNNAQDRDFPGTDIGSPAAFTGTHTWSRLFVLNWSHQAFRSAERALSVNLNVSYGWDRGMFGHLTPESDLDSRNPTMGITFTALDFDLGDMPFPTTDAIIHNVRTNAGLRVPYLGRADLDGAQPYRLNPYGLISNGWQTSGYSAFQSVMNSEDRTTGRLVVDWQANRFHRFTLGGDLKESDIGRWAGAMNEQIFMDAYKVNPLQWGAFASDRLDLGDVVLELGVRYDWYDARTIFPTTPGRIFTHPLWDVNAATDDAVYNSLLNLRADPNDATPDYLQQVFEDSKSHTAISPRLRVSFPITEQTGFRLSYSQQVQSPNFQQMAAGINNDLAFTNTNDVFARDIDFGKSILFEFGVRHAFSQDLVFDVSAYNKDKVSDMAARILPFVDPADVTDTLFVNVLTNRDFGNAKGVDFKVDWRAGSYLNTSVAYTYQISKNTGSDPFSYLNTFARQVSGLTGDRTPPPEAAQRTDDDRTHSLSAAVALQLPSDFRSGSAVGTIFRDVGVFMALRAQSGLPFTPIVNSGDGQLAPRLAFGLGGRIEEGATLNAQVMPWTSNIDLRVNKGFRIGGIDLAAFADVRNLLNQTNTIQVFAETGDVENLRNRTETIGDPVVGSREYGQLWSEAQLSGALDASTHAVTFGNCQGWVEPVNCESLKRVEQRFGNGDGVYSYDEQQNAFNQFYDSFLGTQSGRFYAAQRHIRLGFELNF